MNIVWLKEQRLKRRWAIGGLMKIYGPNKRKKNTIFTESVLPIVLRIGIIFTTGFYLFYLDGLPVCGL